MLDYETIPVAVEKETVKDQIIDERRASLKSCGMSYDGKYFILGTLRINAWIVNMLSREDFTGLWILINEVNKIKEDGKKLIEIAADLARESERLAA